MMNKYLKIGLIGAAALVGVAALVVVYIVATFDPNQYKPLIVDLVKEKKQRTLTLAGDIRLTFFPKLGVDLGRASLSEYRGVKEFAAVDSARFYLAWLPLLRKEVVVDGVRVEGLRANLVRYRDGTTNFDDLLKKEPTEIKFDIAGARVVNAAASFTDEMEGRRFTVVGLEAKTGRLAEGRPTDIELSFDLQGDKPAVAARVKVKSGMTFVTSARRFTLERLDVEARGALAGIREMALGIKGNVDLDGAAKTFDLRDLAVALAGKRGADDLDIRLVVPKFHWGEDKSSAEKIGMVARMVQPKGSLSVVLNVPALAGAAKTLRVDRLELDASGERPDGRLKARLTGPFTADLEVRRFGLPKLAASLNLEDRKMAGGGLNLAANGSAQLDLADRKARADLVSRLDESNIRAVLGMQGFEAPAYTFDVTVDRIDADRYLPPKTGEKAKPPEKPLDFSFLKKLNASGRISIGSLKLYNVRSTNIRLEIRAGNGRFDVDPLSASLYQGSISGALSVAAEGPTVAARQNLRGVSLGPLLKDALDRDLLEGRGNIFLDLAAKGPTVGAMKKALQGKAALEVRDGAIRGINIAGAIRSAKQQLGALRGERTQGAGGAEKTDFSELRASFDIRNGIARNSDLVAKSPLLRLAGSGDIGGGAMNYLAKAAVVATLEGQGGRELADLRGVTIPVRVSGPFTALKYTLDFDAMAKEAVRQQVEQKKEEVKSRLEEQIKEKMEGLFR
jgi:AsmA protein